MGEGGGQGVGRERAHKRVWGCSRQTPGHLVMAYRAPIELGYSITYCHQCKWSDVCLGVASRNWHVHDSHGPHSGSDP